ncbi:MAG: SGNH/GDSL hydrolase family protein [Thermoanaerobaculia bacterium]
MFRRYVALGDSISIDLYPALDAAKIGGWPDDDEVRRLRPGLGAASLFFRNESSEWPEFDGRDLVSMFPGIHFRNHAHLSGPGHEPTDNLATDGATTFGVLAEQMSRLDETNDKTLVTLTVGGNDMLLMLEEDAPPADLIDGMVANLELILHQISDRVPHSLTLVTTVYDPSDATGILEGRRYAHALGWLEQYNGALREIVAHRPARGRSHFAVADIHGHFMGHGLPAPREEFWYWPALAFEPGAVGASEVRRVWLDVLERTLSS